VIARTPSLRLALAAVGILVLALVPAALAGKGGKPGGNGGTSSSYALTPVLANPGDNVVNWGDQVTFTVSTTATSRPFVALTCSQAGVGVYSNALNFSADSLSTTFSLSSSRWTGGAAD